MATIIKIGKEAKKQGFKVGDKIVDIGGNLFTDVLDLVYYDTQEKFQVFVERDGKLKVIKVKKKADTPLGIEIDEELASVRCKNKCKFCFIDQLPKNMRSALYLKDDDYRFSFVAGSYITLTNVIEDDIKRILRLKLSPLYISVHAMDNRVRFSLVKNPATVKLPEIMKRLSDGGIKMHTQLVIVPGINDGDILLDSIDKLKEIEGVLSVAVVPVGITKYREGLDEIRLNTVEECQKIIDQVEERNKKYGGFCYAADEIYLKAGRELPSYEYYKDFPQIENGVGLVREFLESVDYSIETEPTVNIDKKLCLITGVSVAKTLEKIKDKVEKKTGAHITICPIKNEFFGETITVTGLITAGDILKQAPRGFDYYIIPSNMLKEFETVFLDNISLGALEEGLEAQVIVVSETGDDLIKKLSELK